MLLVRLSLGIAGAAALGNGSPGRVQAGVHALSPSSVPNFRDLGHMRCANDAVVRPGMLYRSSTPCSISEKDASQLSGIRTVLDLRSEHDARKDQGERLLSPKTSYLPLLSEDLMRQALTSRARQRPVLFAKVAALGLAKKISPSRRLKAHLAVLVDTRLARLFDTVSLSDVYGLIVSKSSAELRDAFELAASAESLPLLVHCTHGKDRTGVLVALLLLALGVSEDDVVADYELSHDWGCSVEGQVAMRQSFPERLQPYLRDGLLEEWCCAPAIALQQVLRQLERCAPERVQVLLPPAAAATNDLTFRASRVCLQ